jgi:aryl-alcohol dehydrogenase-like predicted oxidoreductase
MEYKKFGTCGVEVSRMGLGCYSMSGAYGAADDTESIATIHRAIERGVTLFDTSASYGQGHNHKLIGKAIKGQRDKVFIHSKTGTIRAPDKSSIAEGSGTPERLREICELSLKNLGIDTLDVMTMSRVDPSVPIEESVGAMGRLVDEGKIRFIGLSEAASASVRNGSRTRPITSLQYEYSLWTRDAEGDQLAACRELGMALMAYAPLGYGFLTGTVNKPGAQSDVDTRQKFPRFTEEHFEANRRRVTQLEALGRDKGATPAQICLAWLLAQGNDVFPIPGCKSRTHLDENLDAMDVVLTPEDLSFLDAVFPKGSASGDRYPPDGMQRVNR